MEGYTIDFAKLKLEYMTKVCNLSTDLSLLYSNLLTHIFKVFNVSLEDEKLLEISIPTINENTLKTLRFKPLPSSVWKHEEKFMLMTLITTPKR